VYKLFIKLGLLSIASALSFIVEIVSIGIVFEMIVQGGQSELLSKLNLDIDFDKKILPIFIILGSLIRIFTLWIVTREIFKLAVQLSDYLFSKVYTNSYKINQRGFIMNLFTNNLNNTINNILYPFVTMLSALLSLTVIVFYFVVFAGVKNEVLIGTTSLLILFTLIVIVSNRFLKKISINIKIKLKESTNFINTFLNEYFEYKSIVPKNVLIESLNRVYKSLRASQVKLLILSRSPRIIIDSVVYLAIATLAILSGANEIINIIMILIIGQRLMPLFNQLYTSGVNVFAHFPQLIEIKNYVRESDYLVVNALPPLISNESIELLEGTYSWSSPSRFHELKVEEAIKISKKGFILLKGPSGSGKSLFIRELFGINSDKINKPEASYLEQTAEFSNSNINEFLSFNNMIELQFDKKIKTLLFSKSECDQFFDKSSKIKNGIDFSPGQIQRLRLLRILSQSSNILILDEPTSAVDNNRVIEIHKMLKNISKYKLILIISHDLQFENEYDAVIEIKDGLVVKLR